MEPTSSRALRRPRRWLSSARTRLDSSAANAQVRWDRRDLPLVSELSAGLLHEAGPHRESSWEPRSAAVIASWSDEGRISPSLARLAQELAANGFETLVVCASDSSEPLVWPGVIPDEVTIYRRRNMGYDFGTWSEALRAFPGLRRGDEVLLVNDSFMGPFRGLSELVADFRNSRTPVWGLVSSAQVTWHLQSHFIGYRGGALGLAPLRRFWREIRVLEDKRDVIDSYELGLSRVLIAAGIPTTVRYPYQWVTPIGCNVTVEGWSQLLRMGFPFLKRELIREPFIQTAIMRIEREDVLDRARSLFGVELEEWV